MSVNIPVIYYHSVAPKKHPTWVRKYLTLELKYFEDHLKLIKALKYDTIFLDEYYHLKQNKSYLKKKKICITFDDGYLDNWIYVFPLLKKYNVKATIFVNPNFVDKKSFVRKTLEDYWDNKATLEDINEWGYLSWDEMRILQKSGVVDIQSHTLTHTKYFVSDEIVGFHYPGRDCLYPVVNLFPERAPYYVDDPEFEKLLPYGYPLFEETSAVLAKKVHINDEFIREVINRLKDWDFFKPYDFQKMWGKIKSIYKAYKKEHQLITRRESQQEYEQRVENELRLSKEIIEKELEKPVEYLCWPHGDNNEFTHKKALEIGYKATTVGKSNAKLTDAGRIFRIGLGSYKNSRFLSKLKVRYKINSFRKKMPWYAVFVVYNKLKYGRLPY